MDKPLFLGQAAPSGTCCCSHLDELLPPQQAALAQMSCSCTCTGRTTWMRCCSYLDRMHLLEQAAPTWMGCSYLDKPLLHGQTATPMGSATLLWTSCSYLYKLLLLGQVAAPTWTNCSSICTDSCHLLLWLDPHLCLASPISALLACTCSNTPILILFKRLPTKTSLLHTTPIQTSHTNFSLTHHIVPSLTPHLCSSLRSACSFPSQSPHLL